ncbi:acyltransferase family protein [Variovorax sp. J22P271]|uniref:acyltransferase family protein n=1 Tax=Variovorax davisae TaxID=3053515 RepID=UPI0025792137|nr:acyltransferase family protein [Variovorax sp. J22P271]MDM0031622.1 acyltransferase family protein [Variovorax sp. J22P271]
MRPLREPSSPTLGYKPEIDGLRALAVLSVIGFHAFPTVFPGGFVGVDVFFVISGYIITRLLHAEWRSTGSIDLSAFYARRVRRIFPMLVVVVACTLVASDLLLQGIGQVEAVGRSAAASLLFVGNLYFQANTGGYFDPVVERLPLLHLWSLGVEEQFYLLWPLLMVLVLRRRPGRLFGIVAACALCSFLIALGLGMVSPNAAFYQMPARFWELAAGGLIALRTWHRPVSSRLLAVSAIGLLVVAVLLPGALPGGVRVPLAVIGAGMLVYASHTNADLGRIGGVLRSRPALFFGLISYSLYLWHWPLLALARAVHPGQAPVLTRAILCAASVALAWASFRLVENPLRHPARTTPDRQLVFAGLLTSLVLAYCSVVFTDAMVRGPGEDSPAARISRDFPENRFRCHAVGDEAVTQVPKRGCNSDVDKPVRVAIWGDSTALAWQPFAWALAQREGAAAISFSRDACPPAIDYDNRKRFLEAQRCREFNARVISEVEAVDTLILSAAWVAHAGEDDFARQIEATVARVAPRVRDVLILGPTPYLNESASACLDSPQAMACSVSRQEFDRQAASSRTFIRGLQAKHANVSYIEPAGFFCDADRCPAIKEGYGLYWDRNHVSSTAVRKFSEGFLAARSTGWAAPLPMN